MKGSGYILFGSAVAGADLLLKNRTEEKLERNEEKEILGGCILYRNVRNYGLVMNKFEKYPKAVSLISATALLMLGAAGARVLGKGGHALEKTGFAMMAAGAVSNNYDRMKRGYVLDYIGFPMKDKKLAGVTYNLADFSLIAGAVLLLIGNLLSPVKTPAPRNGN